MKNDPIGFEYHYTHSLLSSMVIKQYGWLNNNLGERGIRWTHRKGKFWFREGLDLTWFILRWS